MKTSNLTLLSLALVAIFILFGINYLSNVKTDIVNTEVAAFGNLGLNPSEVKGMAIEKAGKIFTLNQEQQIKALSFINNMAPVDKKDYPQKATFDFSRIIIYRFNGGNVSLTPVARSDKDLVFDVPALNSSSYFLSKSGGELSNLIGKATEE